MHCTMQPTPDAAEPRRSCPDASKSPTHPSPALQTIESFHLARTYTGLLTSKGTPVWGLALSVRNGSTTRRIIRLTQKVFPLSRGWRSTWDSVEALFFGCWGFQFLLLSCWLCSGTTDVTHHI